MSAWSAAMQLALALALALAAASCGNTRREHVDVAFRVRSPITGTDGMLDDRPMLGADRLVSWVERSDGQKVDGSDRTTSLPASRLALPALPFGAELVLRTEVYSGATLLARGRSFVFEVGARGASAPADLFVGSLGRFGRRLAASLPADAAAVVASETDASALVATVDGRVFRFLPLADAPLVETTTTLGASTRWLALGTRGLVGFVPTTKSLVFIGPTGQLLATITDPRLAKHGPGAMWVVDPPGTTILLVGGRDTVGGEDPAAVTRIDVPVDPAASVVTALAALPASRWSGSIVWVPGSVATDARALVLGGLSHTAATDAYLVDPRAGFPVANVGAAVTQATGASLLATGGSEVLLVGGASTNDVRRLVVDADATPSLVVASPSPPPLSVRRDTPSLVRFADGLVLVVGGRADAALVRSAEIVDLRAFPGSTVQTGTLPDAVMAPHAVSLADRSVWVLDRGGVFGYVPPRGP